MLLSFARAEMANLYQQLAGSGFAVLLTDPEGVVLNYVSDPEFADGADAGMMPGALWSERYQGTNGIGTCLTIKQPIVIHHAQRFLASNTGLTCSAAPIRDHEGNVLAVLDASSYSHRAQQHTLALVNMSAQALENRLFLWRFKNESVLRFHTRPEFVSTLGEREIALSGSDMVLADNTSAVFQLGCRSRLDLVGKSIGEVFDLSMDSLLESGAMSRVLPIPVHEIMHGNRFFVITQPPESLIQSRRAGFRAARCLNALGSAERDALVRELEAHH